MIKKAISHSRRLAKLKTDSARMLYTWILPHLDIEGRFSADPRVIKGAIVPRLIGWGSKKIENCLLDMTIHKLIILYEHDGDKYLQYRKFKDHQILRTDRESESKIPAPTQLQSNSSLTPAQVKLNKDKLITGEEDKVKDKKENRLKKDVAIKKNITPTKQLFGVFQSIWLTRREKEYKFSTYDGKTAQRIWRQCKKDRPDDPMEYYTARVRLILEQFDIYAFGGIEAKWNITTLKKKGKSWID